MDEHAIKKEIIRLKKEQDVLILAHYYQIPAVQEIADVVGDSYKLSLEASKTDAKTIVFCGVHFMAETAKILSPEKTVLLPAIDAGCPMADKITAEALAAYKQKHPDRKVICYVNSTAAVKALSDVCVTSSNFERVIEHFKDEKLLYVPDKNLGKYARRKFDLDMEVWPGFCCIHNDLTPALVDEMKQKHPDAAFIVHPEAPLAVIDKADYVGGTKGLINFVKTSDYQRYIVGTEKGILHEMRKTAPDKKIMVLTEDLHCWDMKKTDLNTVYLALKNQVHPITVEEKTAKEAKRALDLMLALSAS